MSQDMTETSFEALSVGDRFEIGGQCVTLVKVDTNSYDELVLDLETGSPNGSRSEIKLIIPKGLTCYTL